MSEQWIETCRCGASIKLTGWMYSNTEKAALEWRKNHAAKTHTHRSPAMPDQQPHTPTRIGLIAAWRRYNGLTLVQARDEVDHVIAAAEQRGAIKALRDAAEDSGLIDYMYREYDDHPLRSTLAPAAVRATSSYLHTQADLLEGDE